MKELLTLSGMGILTMLAEMFNLRKFVFPLALIGLATSIAFSIIDWHSSQEFYNMMKIDRFSLAFNAVMCTAALLWCMMAENELEAKKNITDYIALMFFALTGAFLMVSFTNMTMLFLGIEVLSIAMYVLAGSNKADTRSNEAAFKYFLMGSFAAGFLLFGIALIYGVTGTFDTAAIGLKTQEIFLTHGNTSLLMMGILMILVGMGFKVSGAPFHFWTPDVYQGAPTIITAFMATVVKMAAFGAFYRLFATCFPTLHGSWDDVVAGMVVLSLFIGNVSAVMQHDAKRMLAYSSISHAGYMLMAILLINTATSVQNILFYTVSYSLASITGFAILNIVSNDSKTTGIAAFNGLGKRNPILAGAMTIGLLSMAGIPPFSGFLAKYFMFKDVIATGHYWLVLFAVLMSIVGVYYYFKIISAMYLHDAPEGSKSIKVDSVQLLLICITCALLLTLGILPGLIYDLV